MFVKKRATEAVVNMGLISQQIETICLRAHSFLLKAACCGYARGQLHTTGVMYLVLLVMPMHH